MKHKQKRNTGKAVIIGTVGFLSILTMGLVIGLSSGFIKDFFIDQKQEKEQQAAVTSFRENRDVQTEEQKAESGDGVAQLHMALSYCLGEGMEQDDELAYSWMKKSAEQDVPQAQYLVGEMTFQGIGTDKNLAEATDWIKKASENGCKQANQRYAEFAFVGEGDYQDYEVSFPIFVANEENNSYNEYAIGVMYYYGMGTPIDYNLAAVYLKKASESGIEMAGQYLADVTPRVTDKNPKLPETEEAESATDTEKWDYSEYPDMESLIEQYVQKLTKESEYTAFTEELDAMHQANPDVAATLTLFGKDNWLFFQNQADGQSYHDYVGDNHFTEEELNQIKEHLLEQKEKVEKTGAEYVCMIVPNKEIIYNEKMPAYIERVDTITRTDLLVEYLRKETDIDIIYCKDSFEEKKEQYPLYYTSDTHWTMVGSYLALSDLMNLKYGKEIAFDMDMFTIPTPDYAGDLSVILQREDRFHDEVYNLPKENVRDDDCVDDKLLLLGDSFGEFLNMEAQHIFRGGVDSVEIGNYGYQFEPALDAKLESSDPDIVVVECVERYIERLAQ